MIIVFAEIHKICVTNNFLNRDNAAPILSRRTEYLETINIIFNID